MTFPTPTQTATQTPVSVDGVSMDSYCWGYGIRTGTLHVPAPVGANLAVPGRNGTIWQANKRFDESKSVLAMWVAGVAPGAPFGTKPTLSQFYANKDYLTSIFTVRNRLLTVDKTQPNGAIRRALCECTAAIDFASPAGSRHATFSAELTNPAVFWYDPNPLAVTVNNVPSGGTASFAAFAGSTAPIEDGVVSIRSVNTTIVSPTITDPVTGVSVTLLGSIQPNGLWTVNCGTWVSTLTLASGNNDSSYAGVTHTGSARLFTLTPVMLNAPSLVLTHNSGSGVVCNIALSGNRKFHS